MTLDTPQNRAGMPDANFDDWTPLPTVAELVLKWIEEPEARPAQGALVNV